MISMKSIDEYINESFVNILLGIAGFTIFCLVIFMWYLADITIFGQKYSEPNLFMNIKHNGLVAGFVDWLWEQIISKKVELSKYEKFDKLTKKLSDTDEFKQWANQPISKRRFRDLKEICKKVFTDDEKNLGTSVAKTLFKRYTNSANFIVSPNKLEKELNEL